MDKSRFQDKYKIILPAIIVFFIIAVVAISTRRETTENLLHNDMEQKSEQAKQAYSTGEFDKCLKYDMEFIRYAESHTGEFNQQLIESYYRVGLIYGYFKDYPNSLKYNLKGYSLTQQTKNYKREVLFLNNISASYLEMGNYAKGTEYNNKLLNVHSNQERAKYNYYYTRGEIKANTHKGGDPVADWNRAYDIAVRNNLNNSSKSDLLNTMAEYYGKNGNSARQLFYLQQAYKLAEEQKNPYAKIVATRALLDYYMSKDNTQQAVKYARIYFNLSDSSMNARNFIETKNAQERYEQNEAQKKIKDLNITISKQRLLVYTIIIVLIVVIAFLALIIRQSRRMKTAYHALYKMNLEVMEREIKDRNHSMTIAMRYQQKWKKKKKHCPVNLMSYTNAY